MQVDITIRKRSDIHTEDPKIIFLGSGFKVADPKEHAIAMMFAVTGWTADDDDVNLLRGNHADDKNKIGFWFGPDWEYFLEMEVETDD